MRSKAKQLKDEMLHLYDVASVPEGFNYWWFKLLNYCLGIFEYDGLPKSLPAREIELNLIITGHAVIFDDPDLVCVHTELFGYDEYYAPNKAVFGNVKLKSKELVFGENSEIIYNNLIRGNVLERQFVDGGLLTYIKRYARMLADVESTINVRMVNIRQTAYAIATTQQMAEQIKNLYTQQEAGKRTVITDDPFIEAFRTVDIAAKQTEEKIMDLMITRDKILECFFRDIGIKFKQEEKRAQMSVDEIQADEQLLLINIKDMLRERREGLERVNRHYGTNITVRINPDYDRENRVEVIKNGNNGN